MAKKSDLKSVQGGIFDRTELVKGYLNDISKYSILTADEEKALFEKIKKGDQAARNRVVEANQRFVFAVAKRYSAKDKLMDLVEEGNIGLMQAIDSFDPEKGNRFLSHAVWYIRREINAYLINDDLLIRKSNNSKTTYKLNKAKNDFFSENGRYPSSDELMDYFKEKFGIEIKDKSDLYDLRVNSISTTYDDDDSSAFENSSLFTGKTQIRNDYNDDINKDYQTMVVKKILSGLNERDRKVVEMSFGIGYEREFTPQEIGEELGLTGERVRQIKNSAIPRLKKMLAYAAKENL